MKKLSVDELTRLAFVWAEQDRAALADCYHGVGPEAQEAYGHAKQLKEYRLKRWGKTRLEKMIKLTPASKNIREL